MADIDRRQGSPVPENMVSKYKDMLDGTHALVVAADVLDTWRVGRTADITLNNSNKTFVVPAGQEWQVLWVKVWYEASSENGNRQLEVRVEDGGDVVVGTWARAACVIAADTQREFCFGAGLADILAYRDTDYATTPMPNGSMLMAGDVLRVWDRAEIDAGVDDMIVFVQIAWRAV